MPQTTVKISVIIPVYKVEKTLARCVDSITAQSFTDWEMILVDDGSPDAAPQMCDAYAAQDRRIRVAHQQTRGLGAARNAGLALARGEYVLFVDSDDHIAPGTLGALADTVAAHPEYDFLEYPVFKWHGNAKHETLLTFEDKVYNDGWDYWFGAQAYAHTYACNKMFRRGLFEGIGFAEGKFFEDVYTLPPVMARCRHIATSSRARYFYDYHATGITATAGGHALNDLLHAHLPIVRRMAAMSPPPATDAQMAAYYAGVLNVQLDVAEMTGNPPLLPVLPYRTTLKLKLLHLIGIKNLCRLFKWIHKVYRSGRW